MQARRLHSASQESSIRHTCHSPPACWTLLVATVLYWLQHSGGDSNWSDVVWPCVSPQSCQMAASESVSASCRPKANLEVCNVGFVSLMQHLLPVSLGWATAYYCRLWPVPMPLVGTHWVSRDSTDMSALCDTPACFQWHYHGSLWDIWLWHSSQRQTQPCDTVCLIMPVAMLPSSSKFIGLRWNRASLQIWLRRRWCVWIRNQPRAM